MDTSPKNWRRTIPFVSATLAVVIFTLFTACNLLAKAERIVLKNGDLYNISETLGEKRLTLSKDVKFIFAERDGKVLFGKGWKTELNNETEMLGETELFALDLASGTTTLISGGVVDAIMGPGLNAYYTDKNRALFYFNLEKPVGTKKQEKVLFPSISKDGSKLVYQKLNTDWAPGEQFDKALGLTILDISTNKETQISKKADDWAAIFTPNGKKIIFASVNEYGIAGFFSMNVDGSGRTILTNKDQKKFTNLSVALPSERPIFSGDGLYMIYESDKQIWLVKFSSDYTQVDQAKRIAYGINPKWEIQGQTLTVVAVPGQSGEDGVITVDLNGKLIR
ncbi:MAG: hypothetical protein AAB606_05240 [Patescibacteria group bacterium]